MTKIYTMAMLGFGGMAGWHREKLEKQMPRIRVKGIYDVLPEARAQAQEYGLHVYESAEALLADAEVDLVLIATPNNFHKDYAVSALRAGKNVICEKPVTLDATELEEIIAVQKETGKLFSIHQNRRWDTDYKMVEAMLQNETIGKPYFIESRVQGSRGSMHGWRGYKVDGGGMLLDWGVHLIDQALNLIASPVVSVDAHLEGVFSKEVDDSIKVWLRFANGVSYLMEMSTNCFIPMPRWHVSCTEGTMVIDNWDCDGKIVTLKENGPMQWADDIVYTAAGPTRTMAPRPAHTTQTLPLPAMKTDSIAYYENIVAVLDGTAPLLVQPAQALRVMQVIDLAFESSRAKCGMRCEI